MMDLRNSSRDEGVVRGTTFIIIRGNRNFTALKVPSQCPLVLVKVGWKQGKAFGSEVLGGGLLAVGSEGRS